MSVGGLVLFALGLACGVGIAFYVVFSGADSSEPPSEQPSRLADESSVDVEELMGGSGGETDDDETRSGPTTDGPSAGASAGTEGAATEATDADEGGPVHWLEGISGSVAGKCFLVEEATSVGRLPRNDLQINAGDVSRVHCRFRPEGDEVVVEALDTSNGTRVDEREIAPGEPVALSDEDVVEVGKVLLMYHRDTGDEVPEGLGEESSDIGPSTGADASTVTVDTDDWRDRIVDELEAAGGDVSVAAQALGMDPDALERLADQLEIN